jgi:hypothetical protein
MSRHLPVIPRLALTAVLATSVAIAPNWANPASASVAVVINRQPQVHKATNLSGKWSGNYSGSFTGTFELSWNQLGQKLKGTIRVSAFDNEPSSIKGTVHGSAITFGTVGTEAISYSGSCSGNTMSGTWKIQAGGRTMGSGSWSASRA